MKNCAIILASGSGSRLGLDIPKQFYKIKGKTLLEYSIEAFENHKKINSIIIVTNTDYMNLVKEISSKYTKITTIVKGGLTRQNSSYNGIMALEYKKITNVLIHDAARPFVDKDIIDRCLNALTKYEAVNVAIPVTDTIIEIDNQNIIKNVPDRNVIKCCQTPQCFKYSVIKEAHELSRNENYTNATDDCSLVLRYDLTPIFVVEGNKRNIKITYPIDIKLAEEFLEADFTEI